MSDVSLNFLNGPRYIHAMGLPDEHYERIKKAIKQHKCPCVLTDKNGRETEFFMEGKQMKARVGNEVQDVFSRSQAEAQAREAQQSSPEAEMRQLIRSKNPTISEEQLNVACDIMMESVETTKRLIEQGVPPLAARRIVATALQQDDISTDTIHYLMSQTQPLQQQNETLEHP